jgi:hypothetical protein
VAAGTTALVVVFSSFSGFLGHASLGEADPLFIGVTAVLGGILGRLLGSQTPAPILLVAPGAYAILAGLRMVPIKPLPEKDDKAHTAWLAPVGFVFGGLAGLLSAGGKPFSVPVYNWAMGHRPQHAYGLPSVGVTAAAWSTIGAQVAVGTPLVPADLGLAAYAFVLVTLTALGIQGPWSPRLNQVVTWIVSPLLVLIDIRFLLVGLA